MTSTVLANNERNNNNSNNNGEDDPYGYTYTYNHNDNYDDNENDNDDIYRDGIYKMNNNNNNNNNNNSHNNENENEIKNFVRNDNSNGGFKARSILNKIQNTPSVIILTSIIIAIGIPISCVVFIMTTNSNNNVTPLQSVSISASILVILTLIISIRIIYQHLTHWYAPDAQKYVVRILWMVPIYSIGSILSLILPHGTNDSGDDNNYEGIRSGIDAIRDLYEAYVIQSFCYLLMEILGGGDERELVILLSRKQHQHQSSGGGGGGNSNNNNNRRRREGRGMFSLNGQDCDAEEFLYRCKHGVLQYVAAKGVSAIGELVLMPLGKGGGLLLPALIGGKHYFHTTADTMNHWIQILNPYLTFLLNISQMWALYVLVKFYHATSDNLKYPKNWYPLGKFACVKGVVFFTWWQGKTLGLLRMVGCLSGLSLILFGSDSNSVDGNTNNSDTDKMTAAILQDYLVCVEMFCFAVAHLFFFGHEEFTSTLNDDDCGRETVGAVEEENDEGDDHDDDTATAMVSLRRIDDVLDFKYNGNGGRRKNRNADLIEPLLQNHPSFNDISSNKNNNINNNKKSNMKDNGNSSLSINKNKGRSGGDDVGMTDPDYVLPSAVRMLNIPMGFRDALWSSAVPDEMLGEIRRFRNGPLSNRVTRENISGIGSFGSGDGAGVAPRSKRMSNGKIIRSGSRGMLRDDLGVIGMLSLEHAESI